MNYIEDFLERNKRKPFIANLKKYETLSTKFQKPKCVSSFLTHLIIDAENGINNCEYIIDCLSLLNQLIIYENDQFIQWLHEKCSD